jgi:hypothetical protein
MPFGYGCKSIQKFCGFIRCYSQLNSHCQLAWLSGHRCRLVNSKTVIISRSHFLRSFIDIIFHGRLEYFMDICYILWTFGISFGHLIYLIYFVMIWFSFHVLVCGFQEKSGNPGCHFCRHDPPIIGLRQHAIEAASTSNYRHNYRLNSLC